MTLRFSQVHFLCPFCSLPDSKSLQEKVKVLLKQDLTEAHMPAVLMKLLLKIGLAVLSRRTKRQNRLLLVWSLLLTKEKKEELVKFIFPGGTATLECLSMRQSVLLTDDPTQCIHGNTKAVFSEFTQRLS